VYAEEATTAGDPREVRSGLVSPVRGFVQALRIMVSSRWICAGKCARGDRRLVKDRIDEREVCSSGYASVRWHLVEHQRQLL